MAKELQIRRGTTVEHASFTGKDGELSVDTDLGELRLHDNSTAGGNLIGGGGVNIGQQLSTRVIRKYENGIQGHDTKQWMIFSEYQTIAQVSGNTYTIEYSGFYTIENETGTPSEYIANIWLGQDSYYRGYATLGSPATWLTGAVFGTRDADSATGTTGFWSGRVNLMASWVAGSNANTYIGVWTLPGNATGGGTSDVELRRQHATPEGFESGAPYTYQQSAEFYRITEYKGNVLTTDSP
tara:strand:- start:1609 stop:2328 length:720 start_codon:yes stop_codon:yes gene_type:complete